jgi:hypothetical protein
LFSTGAITYQIFKLTVMTNKLIILMLTLATLGACNDGTDSSPIVADTVAPNNTECYSFIKDKDSITLKLVLTDSLVAGNLNYSFFEKDQNAGSIEGRLTGDTIIAEYTFMSEGLQSAREVAFLRKGNNLLEGFGAVQDINGKTVFKDRTTLVFDTVNVLQKVDCSK